MIRKDYGLEIELNEMIEYLLSLAVLKKDQTTEGDNESRLFMFTRLKEVLETHFKQMV